MDTNTPTYKIQIPKPCSQPWDEMSPETSGRHCTACAQTVTDFTRMSDAQILEVLRTTTSDCGRFRADQLNRELTATPSRRRFSFKGFYKLAASLLFASFTGGVAAQTKNTERTVQEKEPQKFQNGKATISGVVTDQFGEPLIGSSIRVEGFSIGVMAGIDGEFELSVPDSVFTKNSRNEIVIKCNYIGAHEYNLRVRQDQLPVNLSIVINTPKDDIEIKVVRYGGMIKDFSTVAPTLLSAQELQKGRISEDVSPKKWWQFWKHH